MPKAVPRQLAQRRVDVGLLGHAGRLPVIGKGRAVTLSVEQRAESPRAFLADGDEAVIEREAAPVGVIAPRELLEVEERVFGPLAEGAKIDLDGLGGLQFEVDVALDDESLGGALRSAVAAVPRPAG